MASREQRPLKRKNPHVSRPPSTDNNKRKKHNKEEKSAAPNPNLVQAKKKKKAKPKKQAAQPGDEDKNGREGNDGAKGGSFLLSTAPAAEQLRFFLHCFQSGTKTKLSPLEINAYNESCIVKLAEGLEQNADNLSNHVKAVFGPSWKETLCGGSLSEGVVDAGSPALLVINTSALRSLELLRGLKAFTRDCRPVKLFAKHMKVEEQVELLKSRVNIASGTPSRIKKLIDMEALSLTRLQMVVLDMQRDAKACSLFTLPQVSTEFWDLYRSDLEQKVLQGETKICFYGAVSNKEVNRALRPRD